MESGSDLPSEVDVAVLLRRAQLRKQTACEAELSKIGTTLPQWGMLHAIIANPGASTHALALFTGQSDQSAGSVVARLEQRELIERHPGPGKAIRHGITPAGAELAEACEVAVQGVMARLIAGIDDEDLRSLRTSLEHIAAAAHEEGNSARRGAGGAAKGDPFSGLGGSTR